MRNAQLTSSIVTLTTHRRMGRLLSTLTFGVGVASAAAVAAGASEVPTLLPGGKAVVTGTHVSCSVTATSVLCKNVGGLTATLGKAGTVRVTRGSRTLFSTVQPRQLHVNGGFILVSEDIYCHVYVAGARTLTCSLVYGGGGAPKTHGFDISDRSLVVFRYDTAGNRHDTKTFSQP